MATFTSSRLGNLRQKKNPGLELPEQPAETNMKLTLPSESQKSSYEPTTTFNNTRTSMRLLKGRIQKKESTTDPFKSSTYSSADTTDPKTSYKSIESDYKPGFTGKSFGGNYADKQDLKLIINDSPKMQSKKSVQQQTQSKLGEKKRILIAKQTPKEEQAPRQLPANRKVVQQPPTVSNKVQQLPVGKGQHIQEQEVEESTDQPQNQNDLIECPEGCGRKFNRKALQKHAKACKLVFMSKRKQFNSEAKRITSKDQAEIAKQTKIKQKKELGKTKGANFGKTGDNWKVASEDFRAALKAIKKDQQQVSQQKMGRCQYCEKLFNQLFMEQHMEHCVQRREKQKKSMIKKKK